MHLTGAGGGLGRASMPGAVRHHPRMRIDDFALERYFARWEFAVEHLLCASDVQGYPMAELLALADDETRALWDDLALGYTESTGHPLLRREIAALYETIEPDEVLVFSGAEEAIFCLLNVLLGPGDHAIVTWPGYQSLYEVGRAVGADVTLHELYESDRWSLDVERLLAADPARDPPRHRQRAPQPDRDAAQPRRVAGPDAGCAAAGVHLLADEVYRLLEFEPDDRLRAGADAFTKGISLGVMSKSFAMAGLRIGWLASHDRALLERCRGLQGLHDDLPIGAVGDPLDHRAAAPARPSWLAHGRSWPRTCRCSTPSSTSTRTRSPGSGRGRAQSAFRA